MSIYGEFPKIDTVFCKDEIPKDIDFGSEIHLDLETTGLNFGEYHLKDQRDNINIIGIGYNPIADGRFTKALICQVKKGKEVPGLKELLEDKNRITYIHHAAFDAPALFDHYKIIPSKIKCTKSLSKLLGRANNRYSDLVKSICGLELPKGMLSTSNWGLPFHEWTDEMRKYCVYDVVYGKWIHDYLYKLCDATKRKLYEDLSNSWPHLIRALNLSSKKGILAI